MKEWFAGLEARERIMLLSGAVVLAMFLVYLLVWHPVHSGYERLKSSIAEQRTTAVWMQESAARVTLFCSSSG